MTPRRRLLILLLLLGGLMPLAARAEAPESRLLYLYVPSCQSCGRVKAVLDALPETMDVTLPDGRQAESRIVVEEINLAADLGTAQALFEAYGVPERDQIAPSVYLRETYLAGADAVEASLLSAIAGGDALKTEAPAEQAAETGALSLWGTVAAGLVGGLNPCALSMLLFFLSVLLGAGIPVGRYAAAFLVAKGACYFLIGALLTEVLRTASLPWLPLAMKVLLTAVSAVLIAMNLLDAYHARRAQYGAIRNQLPTPLRGGLQAFIERRLKGSGAALLLAAVIVGIGVAAGEFLCAGQVYLATLLAGIQQGAERSRMLGLLLAYCVAFLAPSAALTAVVVRGQSLFAASDWLRRHMPLTKLLTAAALVLIVLYAWLV